MLNITLALDILDVDLTKPENCIFIPVNCEGVMGAGLALDFKVKYSSAFEIYALACRHGNIKVGLPSILHLANLSGSIVLFPTKDHWKNSSDISWIKSGLLDLATAPNLSKWREHSKYIHIPKLGCGLGGLEWTDVRPLILQFADMMPEHEIYLYE